MTPDPFHDGPQIAAELNLLAELAPYLTPDGCRLAMARLRHPDYGTTCRAIGGEMPMLLASTLDSVARAHVATMAEPLRPGAEAYYRETGVMLSPVPDTVPPDL